MRRELEHSTLMNKKNNNNIITNKMTYSNYYKSIKEKVKRGCLRTTITKV